MEGNEIKTPTEQLRLKVIKRSLLLIGGIILSCALTFVLPLLYLTPIRVETSTGAAPSGAEMAFPFAALISVIMLAALGAALLYVLYDVIRLFIQYRKSKQMDEVMFP